MHDASAVISGAEVAVQSEAPNFEKLLEEVYISPIRSVLVVDDEFPSLDGFLDSNSDSSKPSIKSGASLDLLRGILQYCRTRSEPWLVDVHDAGRIDWGAEETIATHLHHSDLMILDYHLQGEAAGGEAAIGVLRKLAKNGHFNMVVVYTKGYGQDIKNVFYELVSAFASSNYQCMTEERYKEVSVLVDDLLDKTETDLADLDEGFSIDVYLAQRYARPGATVPGLPKGHLQNLIRDAKVKGLGYDDLLAWLMRRAHDRLKESFCEDSEQRLAFQFDVDSELNWIKLDSLFLTVINKQYDPSQIEPSLLAALRSSDPAPHQLMMAKMRAHMDERGVVAESEILQDIPMQAGWLQELLNAPREERGIIVRSSVDKHWEALGDKLRVDVDRFAQGLLEHLGDDKSVVMKRYFAGVADHDLQVAARLNAYNNSKPVQSPHLMTGHILRFVSEEHFTYWVCLSPACDLVPGQKSSGWRSRLGDFMPFTAVRLNPVKLGTALKKASDNINIFLSLDGAVEAFSFCPEGNPNASPVWEQMFAATRGRLDSPINKLSVTRLHVPASELERGVLSEVAEATVVAQLRYEYALNLLQRLGSNLSRVGLDYQMA